MQQQSHSPVIEQLRTLQVLHQSPDGTLYPQVLPQLHPNDALFHHHQHHHHQQQQYNLSAPPQAAPHPLHFTHHGLPTSPAQYPAYPASYQHTASPRFALAGASSHPGPQPFQDSHSPPVQPQQVQVPLPVPVPVPPTRNKPQQNALFEPTRAPEQPPPPAQVLPPPADDPPSASGGQFQGLRLIASPPGLETWRQKLFDVDDTITLTEEEFLTYFPHIDNVYSHRSTQRHKRKRFVSHYWDCRLKGRPPGTKKSTDPDKKKRKRVARERDLCDVKIKITEYFDQQEYEEQMGHRPPGVENAMISSMDRSGSGDANQNAAQEQFFGPSQMLPQRQVDAWEMNQLDQSAMNMPQFSAGAGQAAPSLASSTSKKYYTFQRVNGNGGNGKGDGVAGPHKHSLEDSDRVKKNSVVRWLAKCEKDDRKKSQPQSQSQGGDPSKKTYHKKATGNALKTVKTHSKENDLKLYGSSFCPFVQRVWISLEHKQIPYQYIEVDPYKKPQSLLDVNPRGLVPALRHGPEWSTHESTVIMEYLEDLNAGPALLPSTAQARATCRLWSDHVNRNVIPWFYKLLQAQDQNDQVSHATELRNQIGKLVDAADTTGPFFLGPHISFVDVQIAPWVIRLRRVLAPYKGWPEAEEGSRWKKWIDAIEGNRSVQMTTSTDDLYLDSYERYAENRPGTSQLADAVNSGRGLP